MNIVAKFSLFGIVLTSAVLGLNYSIPYINSFHQDNLQLHADIKECHQKGITSIKRLNSCIELMRLERDVKKLSEEVKAFQLKITPGFDI